MIHVIHWEKTHLLFLSKKNPLKFKTTDVCVRSWTDIRWWWKLVNPFKIKKNSSKIDLKWEKSTRLCVSSWERGAGLVSALVCLDQSGMPQWRENPTHPGDGCLVRTTAAPEMEEVGFCTKSPVMLLPTSQRGGLHNTPTSGEHSCVTQTSAGGIKTPDRMSLTQIYPATGSLAAVNTHLSTPPSLVTWAWAPTEFLRAPQRSSCRTQHFSVGPS